MKIFQEMAEEWWFEKKYDMARERLGFPALRVKMAPLALQKKHLEKIWKTGDFIHSVAFPGFWDRVMLLEQRKSVGENIKADNSMRLRIEKLIGMWFWIYHRVLYIWKFVNGRNWPHSTNGIWWDDLTSSPHNFKWLLTYYLPLFLHGIL